MACRLDVGDQDRCPALGRRSSGGKDQPDAAQVVLAAGLGIAALEAAERRLLEAGGWVKSGNAWTLADGNLCQWRAEAVAIERHRAALKARRILVDGKKGALLLQIFSENQLGPIFFEFIQRKGNEGFGEGNFKALFESLERDQIRRGALKTEA